MLVEVWLAMFAFGVGATATWAILETRIPLATTTGFAAWAWLAYRSESIVAYDSGVTFEQSAQFLQYFALFMAALSALGLILWYFGDFPPSDEPLDHPEETPA